MKPTKVEPVSQNWHASLATPFFFFSKISCETLLSLAFMPLSWYLSYHKNDIPSIISEKSLLCLFRVAFMWKRQERATKIFQRGVWQYFSFCVLSYHICGTQSMTRPEAKQKIRKVGFGWSACEPAFVNLVCSFVTPFWVLVGLSHNWVLVWQRRGCYFL